MIFLAMAEIRRAKARFFMLTTAIAMLVFLILFQQSLQNGLLTSFVGAIRNQSAPVLVYSVDGQRAIQGSVITPDVEASVRSSPDVAKVGRIGQGTYSAGANDQAVDITVLGVDAADLGAPLTLTEGHYPTLGEAVGSASDASAGFDIGDIVTIQPGGFQLSIVGLADDVQLNAGPTLFVPYETYLDIVGSANPDAGTPLPNILAVIPVGDTTATATATSLNAISTDIDAFDRDSAANETPGVAQVRQSFQLIFLLYGLVVPCVVGLFFLIITFQKRDSLTLLQAIGAPRNRLVGSLMFQALLVLTAGYAIGVALYVPISTRQLGGIPLRFETTAVIVWALILVVLGLASALLSARRVLAIDPIEAATGGAGR